MTQDEIIEMARQAGIIAVHTEGDGTWHQQFVALKAFAKLVAAKEREACAVIAEEWFCGCGRGKCPEGDLRAQDIANSIRARGEA